MADHFCDQHGKVFFQKGKMKGFAHPLEDDNGETVGWCNEDAEEVAKLPAQKAVSPPLQEGKREPTPAELMAVARGTTKLEAPAPQAVGKTSYKADPAKMSSIERQVSIKLACDISSDTETLEQIFAKADKIYQWISGV